MTRSSFPQTPKCEVAAVCAFGASNRATSEAETFSFHVCGLCEMESFAFVNSCSALLRNLYSVSDAYKQEPVRRI